MRFVIGIHDADLLARATASIGPDYPFEIRQGSGPDTSVGCDATLMMFPLAAERYPGADVTSRAAQVLVNDRDDGMPPLIVALPTMKPGTVKESPVSEEFYREWVEWAVKGALAALEEQTGSLEEVTVHIHLEGAAMVSRPSVVLDVLKNIE